MREYIEDGVLKGKKAIALWLLGKDEWNEWVEKNPDARVDFREENFDQYRARPGSTISFEGFKFPNGVSFNGATFGDGGVSFIGAKFGNGDVSFNGATFGNGIVSFWNTTFGDGGVSFERATFGGGDVTFMRATFGDGRVNFNSTTFGNGGVSFSDAKFGKGHVSFGNARFGNGNVSFSDAKFGDGDVIFFGTDFGDGGVDFRVATFGNGDVNFEGTKFGNGDVNFEGTKFGKGNVNFKGATFGEGNVYFRGATFGDGRIDFNSATFGNRVVSFYNATFGNGDVSFWGTKFGDGGVSFYKVAFGDGDVNFMRATFGESDVSFLEVAFGDGDVTFAHAKCGGTFDFRPQDTSKIKRLSFFACTFKGVMILAGTYTCVPDLRNTITSSHVDLSGLKIDKEYKKLVVQKIDDDVDTITKEWISQLNDILENISIIEYAEKITRIKAKIKAEFPEKKWETSVKQWNEEVEKRIDEEVEKRIDEAVEKRIDEEFKKYIILWVLKSLATDLKNMLPETLINKYREKIRRENIERFAAQFCRLKELAEQNRAHDKALDFFAEECRMNRNWEVLSWLRRVPSWLWGGLCWLWGLVPSWLRRVPSLLRRVPSLLWGGLCWLRRVPSWLWGGVCWLSGVVSSWLWRMLLKLTGFFCNPVDVLYAFTCRHGRSIGRPVLGLVLSWLVFSWVYVSLLPWLRPIICSEYSYVHGYEYPKFWDAFLLNIFNSVPFLGFTRHGYKDVFEDVFGSDPILLDYIAIGLQSLTAFIFLFLIGLGIRNRFRI